MNTTPMNTTPQQKTAKSFQRTIWVRSAQQVAAVSRIAIRLKWVILIAVVAVAVALGGAALAQSSANFDLACRGTFSSAGGVSLLPNNGLILVGSLGQPAAGISQSTFWGIKAGYVQPTVSRASSPASITAATEPALRAEGSTILYLPVVSNVIRYVRPCNW